MSKCSEDTTKGPRDYRKNVIFIGREVHVCITISELTYGYWVVGLVAIVIELGVVQW